MAEAVAAGTAPCGSRPRRQRTCRSSALGDHAARRRVGGVGGGEQATADHAARPVALRRPAASASSTCTGAAVCRISRPPGASEGVGAGVVDFQRWVRRLGGAWCWSASAVTGRPALEQRLAHDGVAAQEARGRRIGDVQAPEREERERLQVFASGGTGGFRCGEGKAELVRRVVLRGQGWQASPGTGTERTPVRCGASERQVGDSVGAARSGEQQVSDGCGDAMGVTLDEICEREPEETGVVSRDSNGLYGIAGTAIQESMAAADGAWHHNGEHPENVNACRV